MNDVLDLVRRLALAAVVLSALAVPVGAVLLSALAVPVGAVLLSAARP